MTAPTAPSAHARGWIAALGPGLLPLVASWGSRAALPGPDAARLLGLGLAVALPVGAALSARWPTAGRATCLAVLSFTGCAGAAALRDRPAAALLLGLVVLAGMALLLPSGAGLRRAAGSATDAARAMSRGLVVAWLVAMLTEHATLLPEACALGAALALLAAWPARARSAATAPGPAWRLRPVLVLLALAAVAATVSALGWASANAAVVAVLMPAAVALALPGSRPGHAEATWWRSLAGHPASLLSSTFLLTGLVGGVVLSLPMARPPDASRSLLDALFTSFSATCVTGLVVIDTPTDLTTFGQAVVLALIQVGGLGIMTFSAAVLVLLGRGMSLREGHSVAEILGAEGRGSLAAALRRVLVVTFVAEAAGAAALTALFRAGGEPLGPAAWRGTFTAISAWCNAGFALQTQSLVPYQRESAVLLVVSALIVAGGLGPAVLVAVPAWLGRGRTGLHVRLVLASSVLLLAAPFALLVALEWDASLAHLGAGDRLANAWFQAATPRTAGFNSVDLSTLTPPSIALLEALMFVGGSPGSTAGGIKTTTVAVLLLATLSVLRGGRAVEVAGERIDAQTVQRASAVTVLGLLSFGAALGALLLTQDLPPGEAAFEALSALGTVGLSLGATARLDEVGKLVVVAAMFVGRVGPLSVLLLLTARARSGAPWRPTRNLPVG